VVIALLILSRRVETLLGGLVHVVKPPPSPGFLPESRVGTPVEPRGWYGRLIVSFK